MGEAKRKTDTKKAEAKGEDDKIVHKGLEDTFPASDPMAAQQPGAGITGAEPPPKGLSERAEKES